MCTLRSMWTKSSLPWHRSWNQIWWSCPISCFQWPRSNTQGEPPTPRRLVSSSSQPRRRLESCWTPSSRTRPPSRRARLTITYSFWRTTCSRDCCRQGRQSPRYLYDTICSFRTEGEFSPEYGLTYNMSQTGIYVRTLDPPPKNATLWLELRPSGTTTVHLRHPQFGSRRQGACSRATPPVLGLQHRCTRLTGSRPGSSTETHTARSHRCRTRLP